MTDSVRGRPIKVQVIGPFEWNATGGQHRTGHTRVIASDCAGTFINRTRLVTCTAELVAFKAEVVAELVERVINEKRMASE